MVSCSCCFPVLPICSDVTQSSVSQLLLKDPFYSHEPIACLCGWFITFLFTCPGHLPSSHTQQLKQPHFMKSVNISNAPRHRSYQSMVSYPCRSPVSSICSDATQSSMSQLLLKDRFYSHEPIACPCVAGSSPFCLPARGTFRLPILSN
jgi:hypothetical protein